MELKTIRDIEVKGKRVILRVDFNVPMRDGHVTDPFRINRALPTIERLRHAGASVIILSHRTAHESLAPIAEYLSERMPVTFQKGFGESDSELVLMENVRLLGDDEGNDTAFAERLAGLGEIFVQDAFGALHRKHASIVGIPQYLPSYAGTLVEREVFELEHAFKPEHPFLLILGGIKFESKIGVLRKFIEIADTIFVGGGLANNFFKTRGDDVGDSVIDAGVDISAYIDNPKIVIPSDTIAKGNKILDMGLKSVRDLKKIIRTAKFIVWNGPLGNYETGFDNGTIKTALEIAESDAHVIIGGGNTLDVVRSLGDERYQGENIFLSTGGGSMLEFLASGTLPGLEPLKK